MRLPTAENLLRNACGTDPAGLFRPCGVGRLADSNRYRQAARLAETKNPSPARHRCVPKQALRIGREFSVPMSCRRHATGSGAGRRRCRNAFSDLDRGRGSFSSPPHPCPLALDPIPFRGSLTKPVLPSIQVFAAPPRPAWVERIEVGNGPAVAAQNHCAAFVPPRPVNDRLDQPNHIAARHHAASNLLNTGRIGWWAH